MKTHKKWLLAVLAAFMMPVSVWANMAIPIENPVDHKMVFDTDTGITMVEETVEFSFEGDKGFYGAGVHVSYVLRNEEAEDKSVEMVFVTPYMGEDGALDVRSGGRMIETGRAEPFEEMPRNWKASGQMQIVEPISGKILDKSPSEFEGSSSMSGEAAFGTRFSVDLPAGEETTIEVSYGSESGFYRYQGVINNVFSQVYYLTPAKFYEGEPKVALKISFPQELDIALHSNIPMDRGGNNEYMAELDGLPKEEWLFSFADQKGLVFGTNDRTLHNGIVSVVFAAMMALSVWFWKGKRRKALAVMLGLASVCPLAFFRPSYGMVFLLYMASPLIGIAALVFLAVWAAKKVLAGRRKL